VPEWSERKPSQQHIRGKAIRQDLISDCQTELPLLHPFFNSFLKDMDDFLSPDDLLENFLNEEFEYPREEMDAETATLLRDF